MKTTNITSYAVILLTGLSVLNSCTKEPLTGSVSGTLTAYDPFDPITQIPLKGIKVYLFDTEHETDTLTYDPDRKAVLDSAFTDASGNYLIENIPEGEYAVVPMPGSHGYAFSLANDSVTARFSINEESLSYSVNFRSPSLGSGFDETPYTIHVSIINRNEGGTIALFRKTLLAYDCYVYDNIEYDDKTGSIDKAASEFDIIDLFGKRNAFFWEKNEYKIDAFDAGGNLLTSYEIQLGESSPLVSRWQIDWTARTIKRTE